MWFEIVVVICFLFFKQKTAYELRISDWSSDVCSSDLRPDAANQEEAPGRIAGRIGADQNQVVRHEARGAADEVAGFGDRRQQILRLIAKHAEALQCGNGLQILR